MLYAIRRISSARTDGDRRGTRRARVGAAMLAVRLVFKRVRHSRHTFAWAGFTLPHIGQITELNCEDWLGINKLSSAWKGRRHRPALHYLYCKVCFTIQE